MKVSAEMVGLTPAADTRCSTATAPTHQRISGRRPAGQSGCRVAPRLLGLGRRQQALYLDQRYVANSAPRFAVGARILDRDGSRGTASSGLLAPRRDRTIDLPSGPARIPGGRRRCLISPFPRRNVGPGLLGIHERQLCLGAGLLGQGCSGLDLDCPPLCVDSLRLRVCRGSLGSADGRAQGCCSLQLRLHRPSGSNPGLHILRVTPSILVSWPTICSSNPAFQDYYFGDYYGDQYQAAGIYPWYAVGTGAYLYDPIFAYRSWYDRRRNPHWRDDLRQRYTRLVRDRDLRPPRTWRDEERLARAGARPGSAYRPFALPVAQALRDRRFGEHTVRLNDVEHRNIRTNTETRRRLAADRMRTEHRAREPCAAGTAANRTKTDSSRGTANVSSAPRPHADARGAGRARAGDAASRGEPGSRSPWRATTRCRRTSGCSASRRATRRSSSRGESHSTGPAPRKSAEASRTCCCPPSRSRATAGTRTSGKKAVKSLR